MENFIAICKDPFLALITGLVVGLVFSAVKLPIPAPPVLPGILGIFGIYLGAVIWKSFAS